MRKIKFRLVLFSLVLASTFIAHRAALSRPAGTDRLTIFISDLHLGVGKTGDRWHNYEDARWAEEFGLFLREMDRQGEGRADLIVNGDLLELWQSTMGNDCVYPDKNLGCTEEEAFARLAQVIPSHTAELNAFREFANSGDNRVVIVPGNHDAALNFDRVANALISAIGSTAGRVRTERSGHWVSADGLVVAEHGHQIGKDVNRFEVWPNPFQDASDGRRHLQRTWGEQFVQHYYNEFEQKYPIIDNFDDDASGLKYGFAAEGYTGLASDFRKFLAFYVTKLSWRQLGTSLGSNSTQEVEWDFEAIRKDLPRFLTESMQPTDPLREITSAALADAAGEASSAEPDLNEDDIRSICNMREDMIARRTFSGPGCPRKSGTQLGAVREGLFSSQATVLREHLTETYAKIAAAQPAAVRFNVFVYSHTHAETRDLRPFDARNGWQPVVVNTGAWQRVLRREHIPQLLRDRKVGEKELLNSIRPEDISPACYPAILIRPYQSAPITQLRYWRQRGTQWQLNESCD